MQPKLRKILWFCLLAIAVLFAGYAVFERVWLTELEPNILDNLRLLRWFSIATIAAALLVILLFFHIYNAPAASAPRRWPRLRSISLRTKLLLPMIALAIVPVVAIGIFAITQTQKSLWQSESQRIEADTDTRVRTVQNFLHTAQQDLLFLSQIKSLRRLVDAETSGQTERVAALRKEVEQEFLIFSKKNKRAYYQVRYLNSLAEEVVRLDFKAGHPLVTPNDYLQKSSDPYYADATFDLELGQINVSAIDVNGEPTQPAPLARGMMRYATPVAGETEQGRGLMVINISLDYLFSLVLPLPLSTQAWLVDERGYYLGYLGSAREQRERYGLEQQRALSNDFSAADVTTIMDTKAPRHQLLKTTDTLISFAPIAFDEASRERRCILMIGYPRAAVEAPLTRLTIFVSIALALLVAILSAIALALGFLVAELLAQPVASLRAATQEIAAGNLTRRVEVTTGDEIEDLAHDFNAMTEKLRATQEQLSAWNAELASEVVRQTEHLRHLQSGLARADKLSAIGQMTAGIMHEIGNPLAAIKTKIQVAEEDDELCQECRTLMTEVIGEVNRLAMFLRSFSRLSRLHESCFGNISLAQIVQGVLTLVSPEMQRRKMSLRVESPPIGPIIWGDENKLRQVLINLILNAADASAPGGEILICLHDVAAEPARAGESRPEVKIEVIDRGAGIAAELVDKIWQPFFTTKPEGTGLGLGICRQIMQEHNGTIRAQSAPGVGTTITLVFPAVVTAQNEEKV